uniref:Ribosomal protein L14 n=1 Tax=Lithodesmium undulatum TaxID=59812 RepID=A0A7T6UZN7_LITUN|nr:ribosomal protein L14 [Lithodesmium undulatum]QQJ94650.1 ribosomal protein L14 [Lithodesmium undulatum]
MIQQQSIVKVMDNSGAKTAKCIKVLGGFNKKFAKLGDIIVVSIQKLRNKSKITSKVKKGEVYKALIIRSKSSFKNKDGSNIKFQENAISLITKQGKPVSTRITGSFPKILKVEKFIKFSSLAPGFV